MVAPACHYHSPMLHGGMAEAGNGNFLLYCMIIVRGYSCAMGLRPNVASLPSVDIHASGGRRGDLVRPSAS